MCTGEENQSSHAPNTNSLEIQYKEIGSVFIDEFPQTTVEVLKIATETVLVRNHGTFISDYGQDLFALAFPELFYLEEVIREWEEVCQYPWKSALGTTSDLDQEYSPSKPRSHL